MPTRGRARSDGQCLRNRGLLATLSPATAVCPDACLTALQSSPAPTQARHCNATACPKKPVPKISTRSRRGPAAIAPRRPRPPPNHCRSPPLQALHLKPPGKVFGRPPQERVGNRKNGPDAAPTLTGAPLRLLRRAGPSAEPSSPARLETTSGKRLHLEPEKTRPHRRPDVLAPGRGSIMSTEAPRD